MSVAPTTARAWTELAEDLLGWFARRGCAPELAEDLRQETFLRVHRHLPDLRAGAALAPWVYRIARSVLVDHLRRQRPQGELPELEAPALDDPGEDARVAGWLVHMIDALPAPTATALRRVELEGWSQARLAREEGISLSGARSRVQRGRRLLRQRLEDCCEVWWQGEVVDWRPRQADRCGCGPTPSGSTG